MMFCRNFKFSGLYSGPYCRIRPANLVLSERYNKAFYVIGTEILNVANQEHERQNFTVKNIVRSISNANDEISLVMNERI